MMSANIEDDEAPPDLVDVSEMPADQTESIEEEATARVPITLVTGMVEEYPTVCSQILNMGASRLSGCGEDHLVELYLDREARQKDRCHHEWFVFVKKYTSA